MNEGFSSDVSVANEQFTSIVSRAAEVSIPKFAPCHAKSYPAHIVELIKTRRVFRKGKKLAKGEEKTKLTTEYNRLTSKINKAIREYTEKRWSRFL
jgi:hypothetical protein